MQKWTEVGEGTEGSCKVVVDNFQNLRTATLEVYPRLLLLVFLAIIMLCCCDPLPRVSWGSTLLLIPLWLDPSTCRNIGKASEPRTVSSWCGSPDRHFCLCIQFCASRVLCVLVAQGLKDLREDVVAWKVAPVGNSEIAEQNSDMKEIAAVLCSCAPTNAEIEWIRLLVREAESVRAATEAAKILREWRSATRGFKAVEVSHGSVIKKVDTLLQKHHMSCV